MKRILSLCLVLITVLNMFSACLGTDVTNGTDATQTTAQAKGPSVTVWWFTDGGDFETLGYLGEKPVPPEIEETLLTEKYVMTFTGWDKELTEITPDDVAAGELFFRAKYNKVKRTYKVTFVADGKTVATKECYYGDSLSEISVSVPEKEGYLYAGWECDLGNDIVTKDCTCTAAYANKATYTIQNKTYIKDGVCYMPIEFEKHANGRSTPAAINTGKGYDSLIFYTEEADSVLPDPNKTVSQMLTDMNIQSTVIFNDQQFLGANTTGSSISQISIDSASIPFTKAKHVVISAKNTTDHATSVRFSLSDSNFDEGDVLLLSCWIRVNSSLDESGCGQIRMFCENASWSKNLNCNVSRYADGEWFRFMTTFSAKKGYTSFGIAFASCVQNLDIAGFEIRNCGAVDIDSVPRDSLATLAPTLADLYDKDAQWRKDAWAKIEEIRMGDVNVVVKDANGNVIPDAEVKVNMTEHDFKWGTCIAEILMNNQDYNNSLSAFFNSAVSGTGNKWACYEREPERALNGHKIADELGITYFRGHCLQWDVSPAQATDEDDNYKFHDLMPERLWKAIRKNNKTEIMNLYDEWFKTATETFSYVGEWDVLNEPNASNYLITKYGVEMVKYWFDLAKKYAPEGTKLYLNETSITNAASHTNVEKLCTLLDKMSEMGVDFDGIGIQGHTDQFASPLEFYNNVLEFAKYGKELKITEFDTGRMFQEYPYAEASWIRDVLILLFSIDEMDGFFMWGFWDKMSGYGNAPLFDGDWNLKISGEQYLDLVYNQWWTRESGKTDANGVFSTRAYYGTYDITVTANGKTVTQTVSMAKGETGDFTVTVK